MSRAAHLARLERERLLNVARRGAARLEAREIGEGVAETVGLSMARGAAFETTETRRGKTYRRQAGLEWLCGKGRLTAAQRAAGERYGACYRKACGEVAIASTLDIRPGGGEGAALDVVIAKAHANVQARARLTAYRKRLWDQAALVSACDKICGQELTPREAASVEREAYQLEAVLAVALDILASEGRDKCS